MSQFLTEAFLLSAAGTALGLLLAFGGVRVLLAFGAADLPRLGDVPFDVRVLLFGAGTLALATVLVALLPAARLANPDIRGLLSESGWSSTGTSGTRKLLSGLVVVEIALGIALVSGAGWLTRSYQNLAETDPGFTAEGRLVFEALLSALDAAPEDAWAIGDNLEFDVLAPMQLGLHGIWVDRRNAGLDGRPGRPHRIVSAFTEIVA